MASPTRRAARILRAGIVIAEIPWAPVAGELAGWLDATRAAGTTQFVDARVVLHTVVAGLFRRGVPPGVAHPGVYFGTHAEAWFDDPHPAVLVVAVDFDESANREQALTATRRVVDAAFIAAHHDADSRLVCVALSRRAKERLDGFLEPSDGDRIRLPFDRLRALPGGGDKLGAMLSGRALCEAKAADGVVLVWSVEKPDVEA